MRSLLPLWTRPAARQLLRVLDELTLRREKPNWVEKTPRHLPYIPFLESWAGPGSGLHFVHVIREGLEVVASLHEASQSWSHPYDLETCVRRWNEDVGFSRGRIGAPRDHFIFYEELTGRPEATLRRVLAALGLGWEPEILERYAAASAQLVAEPEEGWKANVGRAIHRSGSADRVLTEEQRQTVTRSLRPGLYDQLYELAGQRLGEVERAP